jgi:hypothetical protein
VRRVTIHDNPTSLTVQLEGKLAGPWVSELAKCWQGTVADRGRPVDRVDLAALTSIDAAGKELLAAMHARGAELVAADCLMKAVVAEIIGPPVPLTHLPTLRIDPRRNRHAGPQPEDR